MKKINYFHPINNGRPFRVVFKNIQKCLILIIFVCFIVFVKDVNATSGACSWHSGVNCSAGADWDGSVVCNDGWRDSSVSYSSSSECQTKFFCTLEEYIEFKNQYVTPAQQKYDAAERAYESFVSSHAFFSGPAVLLYGDAGRQEQKNAIELNLLASKLKIAQDTLSSAYETAQTACEIKGLVDAISGLKTKQCKLSNSELNISGECVCKSGYKFKNGVCMTYTESCQYSYGRNVIGELDGKGVNQCSCETGYKWNDEKTACIKVEVKCPENSSANNGVCQCKTDYKLDPSKTLCIKNIQYVTTSKVINLREKPTTNSKVIGQLKKNMKYQIVDLSNKDWAKIKYSTSKDGWALKRLIKIN